MNDAIAARRAGFFPNKFPCLVALAAALLLPPEDLLGYKVDFADGEAPDIRFDGEMNHEIHETHETAAEVDHPRGTAREERTDSGIRFVWRDGDDGPMTNMSWRCVALRVGAMVESLIAQ